MDRKIVVNSIWENFFRRRDDNAETLEALRGTFVFETLTRQELRFVAGTVHQRTFKAGEPVFRQGEIGVGMYIIRRGSLDVFVEPPVDDAPAPHVVTRLRAGDFLGELALVEPMSRRTAGATAAEESVLIGFFKPDLLEILDRQPATGVKILLRLSEVLGRRLKETTVRLGELKAELRRATEKT